MTAEQYTLLVQYVLELNSALCAYEDQYGIINLESDPIKEIVSASAKLIHFVDSLEPIFSSQDEDPF